MIFACGVRVMRLRSDSFNGCASGSARAAVSIASRGIGLGIPPEVIVLLTLCCPRAEIDTNLLLTFSASDKQEILSLCHADRQKTILTIIFTIVKELGPQRIL
jgi:hypothetical protein